MATNIDTQSLTQVITEFRRITAKDAVTPENLGSLLQRITNLLATAGTSEVSSVLMEWYERLTTAADYISSIEQGESNPDKVNLMVKMTNPLSGAATTQQRLQLPQASSGQAGAMRAQHVVDLYAAKKTATTLERLMADINESMSTLMAKLGLGNGSTVPKIFTLAQVTLRVVNGQLRVIGASPLLEAGYVPYLFRNSRKRNRYRIKTEEDDEPVKKHCATTKGWHLFGSIHTLKISRDRVLFTTNDHNDMSKEASGYTSNPKVLVSTHVNDKGVKTVGWGRSCVALRDYKSVNLNDRMIRLRFAIGFGKPISPGKIAVTPANLISTLAEFSVVYNPVYKVWSLSR